MRLLLFLPILAMSTVLSAQGLRSGRWDVTSKVVEIAVPGVPGFLQRMARGHSSAEHKTISANQGLEALFAPDPKAHCVVNSQRIVDGRYVQSLSCPQHGGEAMIVTRSGTYDGSGFSGQAIVTGTTPKGTVRIVLDQHATYVGG